MTFLLDLGGGHVHNTPMPANQFTLTMRWAKMLTPYVRHLAFEKEDGETLQFKPGQFITIHFQHKGVTYRRSYSLATLDSKYIEFSASHVPGGVATQLLFNLEPGDQINVAGPSGRLVLHDEEHPKRYIFMATGTGVTRYRTMLPLLEKILYADNVEAVVLQGVQRRQDLLYGDDFVQFAKRHPNFHFWEHGIKIKAGF